MNSRPSRRSLLLCAAGLIGAIGAGACRRAQEPSALAKPRNAPIANPHASSDECERDADCFISVDRDCCNNCCASEPFASNAANKRAHDSLCASVRCMNPHCETVRCAPVRAASDFAAVCENHQCRRVERQPHEEAPSPLLKSFTASVCPRLQRMVAEHQDAPLQLFLATFEQHLPVFALEPGRAPGAADMTTDWFDTTGARFCTDGGISGGDCLRIFPLQKPLERLSLSGTAAALSAKLSCGG